MISNKLHLAAISVAAGVAAFSVVSCKDRFEPAAYVNPFIGASTNITDAGAYHGLGKTFPGATTPYGMVQVSPNTITGGDNAPGYSDEHRTIEGFAMTQMSGTGWFGDLGNFQVMPTRGPLRTAAGKEDGSLEGWRSSYDKASEMAEAGYYSVFLDGYGIKVETSATPRCGIIRFTFPEDEASRIQVDLSHRMGGCSDYQKVSVIDDHTIEGWIRCTPECGGWGDGDGKALYTVYFHATLDRPWTSYGFWEADIPEEWSRHNNEVAALPYQRRVSEAKVSRYSVSEASSNESKSREGRHTGFFAEFPTSGSDQVTLKVGISFVDLDGARANYEAEIASKDFDTVRSDARKMWNEALGKIRIEGGTDDEKTIFYTSLYHTMIDPRIYSDVDGRYTGGDYEIHTEYGSFHKRTIFSGWDVFRSQFPLMTLINPGYVEDAINSFTSLASESGREYYERWEFLNSYSGCMLGNPALPVIADAYVKGIRGFDAEKALEYMVNSSRKTGNGEAGYTPGGLCISHTLEYAYADWCVYVLAKELGHNDIAEEFLEKSRSWRTIFDTEKGWFRPKDEAGEWFPWPENALTTEWYGCIECNPFQQGWFVPHDVEGMVGMMGGREAVLAKLDSLFENTPEDMLWNQYYNHANEPVHFVPYLYNRIGEPHKTQYWTRFICSHAYKNAVKGLVGNEDEGQMSAWYVLTASGLHPSCPGDGRLEITSPVFDRIDISLDRNYYKGGRFTIIAKGNAPGNVYIKSLKLNGKPLDRTWLSVDEVTSGGTLELEMTDSVPQEG